MMSKNQKNTQGRRPVDLASASPMAEFGVRAVVNARRLGFVSAELIREPATVRDAFGAPVFTSGILVVAAAFPEGYTRVLLADVLDRLKEDPRRGSAVFVAEVAAGVFNGMLAQALAPVVEELEHVGVEAGLGLLQVAVGETYTMASVYEEVAAAVG